MQLVNLISVLKAAAGVQAIVADRVFYGTAPQGSAFPYILVQNVTLVPENYLAGVPGIDVSRIQIKPCSDQGVSELFDMVNAIDNAMNQIAHCVFVGTVIDHPEGKYEVPMDYRVWQSR